MNASVEQFALPDLGEGLTEAELLRWLVAVGDTVAVDQPVAEVETAKTTVEVPVPFSGRVSALHAAAGETIGVGATLLSVDSSTVDGSTPTDRTRFEGAGEPAAEAPNGGGRYDSAGDTVSGAVLVGSGVKTGARTRRRAAGADTSRTMASGAASASHERGTGRVPVVSPLVRRRAREYGIDVTELSGSGTGGMVLRRDVEEAIGTLASRQQASASDTAAHAAEAQRVPLGPAHRAMAERVARSRREIPEATVWVDADATGMLDARSALNASDPQRPVSVLGLLAKFCLLGLRRFPELNSRFDAAREEVVRFSGVNLGFAAQTSRGLLVPVLHGAQHRSLRELSAELRQRTEAARSGSLAPAELSGGTFTVNNYGVFGVDGSAAVINHPEAAILGMGRIVNRPWVCGDQLEVRPVTELTLAFDHRVCDGGQAGGFLRFVADCVERPAVLLDDV
ncbi:pyruvate dehydrogenase E2 component (dihydrolipoamide acetyltransferase) [Haloactinospora alba]|uniref:Dihydrolipoamide acetyltransferase component of pyruvate dehydrogenase complex n=1 Tax=Haloactinospora alba TaxID=405555 RepID=A0A543NH89_9ACTN|nr:dihydrolipoamide acetyltransferase family protein [Haloactinospora alba]TQN31207.1 pyruvate dehydrogenase E2 component (dihydrolipoamide acetyltransferase) [Haloactinospora alba]